MAERRATGSIAGLPLDDAWIHLVLGRSLAAGDGLSLRAGELVAASTAPLWTALVALASALPGEPHLPVKLLGLACSLGAVGAAGWLARALGLGRGLALVAALAVATTDWIAWSALSGMEIPLFTLLSLVGLALHAEERAGRRDGHLPLLVLSLAVLARPEGVLLVALAVGERLAAGGGARARLATLAADLVVVAAVVSPVAAAHLAIGGSPLPTTFAAKVGGAALGWPRPATLLAALALFFRSQPLLSLLSGGGTAALAARRLAGERVTLVPAAWLAALPLAFATLEGPPRFGNFGRYLFPLLPLVAVIGTAGLAAPAAALSARRSPRLLAPLLAALVLLPALPGLAGASGRYARSVADVAASDLALARALAPRLPGGAVLAVADIGVLGYLLPNRLIDLGLLASPDLGREVAAAAARGVPPDETLLAFLRDRGADYVATYPEATPLFARRPDLFRPLLRLEIPRNRTMAGDELVLYATAWNRHPLSGPAPTTPRRSSP